MKCIYPAFSLDAHFAALTIALFEPQIKLYPLVCLQVPLRGTLDGYSTLSAWANRKCSNEPRYPHELEVVYLLGAAANPYIRNILSPVANVTCISNVEQNKTQDTNELKSLCQLTWRWFNDSEFETPKAIDLLAELIDINTASNEAIGLSTYLMASGLRNYAADHMLESMLSRWRDILNGLELSAIIDEGLHRFNSAHLPLVC